MHRPSLRRRRIQCGGIGSEYVYEAVAVDPNAPGVRLPIVVTVKAAVACVCDAARRRRQAAGYTREGMRWAPMTSSYGRRTAWEPLGSSISYCK